MGWWSGAIDKDTETAQNDADNDLSRRQKDEDADLQAFFSSLETSKPQDNPAKSNMVPVVNGDNSSDISIGTDISPRTLYPREMSCRDAFDQAYQCGNLGGKFNDIYRFGSLQPCSEQWGAFWFCMRMRSFTGTAEQKGEMIADHYEEREEREKKSRAGGRSSEDVWEIRTKPVERAFWKKID